MFINTSTLVAVLGLVSAAPALAAPTYGSSLPSVRRSLASKLERRAEKLARQNNRNDPQKSLTLDPSQVAPGLAQNGQAGGGDPGQVASLTSTNNYINFCLTQNVPLTNGQQVKSGSCNAVPMGRIIGVDNMPSSKFSNPKNGDVIPANQAFTITMQIKNLVTGNFVNPNTNYYSAPQQVDGSGTCIGHSHVTVELLPSLDSTQPLDNRKFAFFKGFNAAAQGGVLSAAVTAGLPAGAYRMCSINSAANHQPVLVAVAQRGSTDDCVYFTASNNAGGNAGGNGGNTGNGGNNGGNTGGNGGNTGTANLQKFTGTLGGAPPAVTAGGRGFVVQGNSFLNKSTALQRSCDIQRNACLDAANRSGNKAPLTITACENQGTACSAAIASA
ncbi:hypothetical protein FRC06_001654 [Ceratobasidium sp. 370]|nr:hypothetical protein FRC06_001654 [Ceratobasidium sp. 370]